MAVAATPLLEATSRAVSIPVATDRHHHLATDLPEAEGKITTSHVFVDSTLTSPLVSGENTEVVTEAGLEDTLRIEHNGMRNDCPRRRAVSMRQGRYNALRLAVSCRLGATQSCLLTLGASETIKASSIDKCENGVR